MTYALQKFCRNGLGPNSMAWETEKQDTQVSYLEPMGAQNFKDDGLKRRIIRLQDSATMWSSDEVSREVPIELSVDELKTQLHNAYVIVYTALTSGKMSASWMSAAHDWLNANSHLKGIYRG